MSRAPFRNVPPWLGWLLLAVAILTVAAGIALVTAPSWGRAWVQERLVEKLENRLEEPVSIGGLQLEWGSVQIDDLRIGEGDPSLQFDRIDVEYDTDALWSRSLVVRQVEVTGGRIEGTRAGLESLAHRALRRRETQPDEGGGGHQLIPEHARVRGLSLELEDHSASTPRRLETRLFLDASPREHRARAAAEQLRFDPGVGPRIAASKIQTQVSWHRDDEGRRVVDFPLTLELEGVGAPITKRIAVAGARGSVTLSDPALTWIEVELASGFADRSDVEDASDLWSIAGKVRRDLSEGYVRADMDAFELGRVPQVLAALPLVDSESATVEGEVAVVFGRGIIRLEGDVAVDGLNVDHRTLAREVVRDIGFGLQLAVEVDPGARWVRLDHAVIERRGVELRLSGEFSHPIEREERWYRAQARVPAVPCQQVLDAIPAELVPSLQGFALGGEFSASVRAEVDFSDLEALVLDGSVGIHDCRVEVAAPHAAVNRLATGFTHRVVMRDGSERVVQMYPTSGSFTPLQQISPHMVNAVLTTEDGGFWRHRGFLPSQFEVALRRNLAAGQIELGASTITMQMVKNVLLSHERTLARKLQEMFLTWYVETVLTKNRIMEIYLNAIEFGPGVYGITQAAEHYFGKHPSELLPREAVYLALMLPSPVRRHVSYCQGSLTRSMEVKVQRILEIMVERGKLSQFDFVVWGDVPLVFDPRDRGDPEACMDRIDLLLAGTHTQRALSGLLGNEPFPFDEPPPAPVLPSLGDDSDDPDDPADPDHPTGSRDPTVLGSPAEADAPGRPAMEHEPSEGHGAPW